MLTQEQLKKYAYRLVREAPLLSDEESVGIRLMTLIEAGKTPEQIVEFFQTQIDQAFSWDDVRALEKAVQHIREN